MIYLEKKLKNLKNNYNPEKFINFKKLIFTENKTQSLLIVLLIFILIIILIVTHSDIFNNDNFNQLINKKLNFVSNLEKKHENLQNYRSAEGMLKIPLFFFYLVFLN